MKARVKATGEIITIESDTMFIGKDYKGVVKPYYDIDIDIIKDEPDYWEKLRHQYAGMAMQGMFANPAFKDIDIEFVVLGAVGASAKLINKLKEEEK